MGRGGNVQAASAPGKTKAKEEPFDATVLFVLWPRPGKHAPSEDGAVICRARHHGHGGEVILKGKFGPVVEGQVLAIKEWALRRDARGEHIRVWRIAHDDPTTPESLRHYLAQLPGVGEAMAAAIVDHFGAGSTLAILDEDPSRLLEVATTKGHRVSVKKLVKVKERWQELRAERRNMLFLSDIGLGDAMAKKVVAALGADTKKIVSADPYVLAQVPGIGFRSADAAARKMGVRPDDERRVAAGIEYLMQRAKDGGHICLNREEILDYTPKLLALGSTRPSAQQVEQAIKTLIEQGRLVIEEVGGVERIYSYEHFIIETRIYEMLKQRLTRTPEKLPEGLERPEDAPVTDEQWLAVERGLSEPISVLTGSAGCGKTFALKELIAAAKRHEQQIVLLAPTGKAAKRITESTGEPAETIHRRLGREGLRSPVSLENGISEEAAAKLKTADIVVVDEASMLNMEVAERLISHLPADARLVLVGDPNQLPAIGAGSVLHDLIGSERVPTTKLTKIFRQAEDSLLVVNANRIKDGKEPYWTREEAEQALGHPVRDDFEFIAESDPERAEAKTMERAIKLASELGVPDEEIMVTAPTKKGAAGVGALNDALRAYRNPRGERIRGGDLPLHEGDWVMNTKNRYPTQERPHDPEVMNGDQGRLIGYDPETRTAWVKFEGIDEEVTYHGDQIDSLIPAYAATTHKLQGSEAAGLIAPYARASQMLSRNLIYTALTRGKRKAVMIGDKDVIRQALSVDGSERKTTLDLRVEQIPERLRVRWEVISEAERRQRQAAEARWRRNINLANPFVA